MVYLGSEHQHFGAADQCEIFINAQRAIDKSYYPITPTKTGYHLMLQDGVEADINFLDTDYETYGILKVTLIEGDNSADHLCIVSDSPSLADGLTSTVSDLMQELGGQSLSEIEQINNEDCPIDSKTSQAV